MIGSDLTCLQVSLVSFEPHALAIDDRDFIANVDGILAQVVSNANLAETAKEIGLVRHMSVLNPGIKDRGTDHILGTIVEALLGAIHEDSGKNMEAVRRAMYLMGLTLPESYIAKSSRKQRLLKSIKREVKRLREHRHTLQDEIHQNLSEHKDLDEGSLGHRYQIAEEQATNYEDLEALDSAPERLYDMGTDAEISEDYVTDHAFLEDADSNQIHLGDDQTGLEASVTHQESNESTDAGFTSSSWRQFMRKSGDSPRKLETVPGQGRAKPTSSDFDRAMEAIMFGESEWPVRHGWYPQHCQITLDVAMSKNPHDKKQEAACEPDRQLAASSLDVAPPKIPRTTKKVAAAEPDRPLAGPTLDDIALPPLQTTKEVAIYEPGRLRLVVAP